MHRPILAAGALVLAFAAGVASRRISLDVAPPRPTSVVDSVWIEELTGPEVRDAIRAGKTTAIVAAGSTEENGPYLPTGKHAFVLRLTAEAVARKLGNALVAPLVPFEPGDFSPTAGGIHVRPGTFEAFVEDEVRSLLADGFRHVVLVGDSAGDQQGLENVARRLAAARAPAGPSVHYIREYYDSWIAADGAWASLGVTGARDDGIHDDYSASAIVAVLDPEKIRFRRRQETGQASINGQTLLPLETTVSNGRKLVEIRASLAAEAIRKAVGDG